MIDKIAKVHTHVSNRAKKLKSGDELEKKSVQKSALDNPFRVDWPSVPVHIQNACFSRLNTSLEGLSNWRQALVTAKKRKRTSATGNANGSSPMGGQLESTGDDIDASQFAEAPPSASNLQHMSMGINAVTKRLEAQIAASRQILNAENQASPLRLVFVCRSDVDPPLLINHLPHIVAAINTLETRRPKEHKSELVTLVPLPKGSELQLSTIVGVRRLAVLAFDEGAPALAQLLPLVESVPILIAPWLGSTLSSTALLPMHVKQIRTTAPKDMKASKEKRALGRAAAKERKRIKLASRND